MLAKVTFYSMTREFCTYSGKHAYNPAQFSIKLIKKQQDYWVFFY